jgi:hypothetical protein
MKSKYILSIIGCMLLAFSNSREIHAQTNDYGTKRKPRTCSSKVDLRSGKISIAQAERYIACREEKEYSETINFIDITSIQFALKPIRNPTRGYAVFASSEVDFEKPIYYFRADFLSYTCFPINTGIFQPGKNCTVGYHSKSPGMCYHDIFGDWSCSVSLLSPSKTIMLQPPPL